MYFAELASLFDELSAYSSRLKKTDIIAGFLARASEDVIEIICTFLTGRIFPAWDPRDTGVAGKTVVKVIADISGKSNDEVVESYRDTGHLGITAEQLLGKKVAMSLAAFEEDLTVVELYHQFEEMAATTGERLCAEETSNARQPLKQGHAAGGLLCGKSCDAQPLDRLKRGRDRRCRCPELRRAV